MGRVVSSVVGSVVGRSAIVLAVLLVSWTWGTLPPRTLPATVETPSSPGRLQTIRGALHAHTTRSDGLLPPDDVARAAGRAGLHFVVLADHGDGTRSPVAPHYVDGVLVLDGVEVSTASGHYIAVDLPRTPYPLGGDAAGVIEDVRRLGGFGIVAHPASPAPNLAWRQQQGLEGGVDGIEWLNADSAWRTNSLGRLFARVGAYLLRPKETVASLIDRPTAALAKWDEATRSHRVVGVAGTDAHGPIDYETLFRTFSVHAELAGSLTGDPAQDATRLMDSLRAGHVFTAIDAIASPATLKFEAVSRTTTHRMGQRVPAEAARGIEFRATVSSVPGVRLVLIADGESVFSVAGPELRYRPQSRRAAVYRVEARIARQTISGSAEPQVLWMASNPIYVGGSRGPLSRIAQSPRSLADVRALHKTKDGSTIAVGESSPWLPEHDPQTSVSVGYESGELLFSYALSVDRSFPDAYAAVSHRLPSGLLINFDAISFSVSADRPVRISGQLRDGKRSGEPRWRTSFWANTSPRKVTIPFSEMQAVGPGQTVAPSRSRIDSILFVADLVNSRHGDEAVVRFADLQLERW